MNIVILAAGLGKRMLSDTPKVLHRLAGRSLLSHVLDTARQLSPGRICIVYGHGGELVREALGDNGCVWVRQEPQLGTGHAVMQAVPHLDERATTLVLYGDVPLIRPRTLERLIESAGKGLGILTATLDDPAGYGRVIRSRGRVVRIVEERDTTARERTIREVNTGMLAAPTARLKGWLAKLKSHNAQKELYLTDVVALANRERVKVTGMSATGGRPA